MSDTRPFPLRHMASVPARSYAMLDQCAAQTAANGLHDPLIYLSPADIRTAFATSPDIRRHYMPEATDAEMARLDQFIKTVKSRPGKYIYGSSGVGTALHLSAEMAKQQAGLFMSHIPYRGVGPLTTDLYAGTVDFGVYVLSSGLPHIRGGKVVALGITEKKRSAVAPEIAPLADRKSVV